MKKSFKTCNRYFCIVLYPDDENYEKYFENIKQKFQEVTWITHNKDVNEYGELKKEHTHVIFKVGDNARWINSVAEDIGIEPNYIEGCNKKAMLQYLIHMNQPDKTQYNINDVKGELKDELAEILFKREPEENKLAIIMQAIITNSITTIQELLIFSIESGLVDVARKYQFILTKTIEERNRNVNKRLRERLKE